MSFASFIEAVFDGFFSNHVDGLGPGCALWHDRVAAGVVTWSWSPRCSFGLKISKCLNCCRHHVDSLLLPLSAGLLVYSVAQWPWCGTNKDACKRLSLWLGAFDSCPALSPEQPILAQGEPSQKKAWEKGEELRQAVKAMDNQHLVEIARQYGGNLPAPEAADLRPGFGMQPVPDDQAGPRPGLPLRRRSKGALLRLLGTKQNCQTLRSAAFRKQAAHANSTGRNRTKDFVIPDSSSAKRQAPRAKGKWKQWTPDAVLRAAFANDTTCRRTSGWRQRQSCRQLQVYCLWIDHAGTNGWLVQIPRGGAERCWDV